MNNCGHLTSNVESPRHIAGRRDGVTSRSMHYPFLPLRFTSGSLASRGRGGTNCNGGNYDTVRIKTGKVD